MTIEYNKNTTTTHELISFHKELVENSKLKQGDVVTRDDAERLFQLEIIRKSKAVTSAVSSVSVNQHQYDSLVSFAYNVGIGALLGSTLLKRVKVDPVDPTIRDAFMMWDKITKDGQLVVVQGLANRRKLEADLYFS